MLRHVRTALLGAAIAWPSMLPGHAQEAADAVAPEVSTALAAKGESKPVEAQKWMIAAANPLAVKAGADVLRRGGSAADAAIAAQLVLGLVEPQSSGLGGGAFVVWYDAGKGKVTTLDARETAPSGAKPTRFQTPDGEPMKFFDAVVGPKSVGVPGTPKLLMELHARYGKVDWDGLFDPAISLAREGFEVSPRLAGLASRGAERLSRFPATRDYFVPGGKPITAGDVLRNEPYAKTLEALRDSWMEAFYEGEMADALIATLKAASEIAGHGPVTMTKADLANYRVVERDAVCTAYRGHDVCGMGPPSSGALTVGQILGMAESFDLKALGPDNPEAWRIVGDASRLAFSDRGRYMADSDYVPMPTKGLVAPDYLKRRADLLRVDGALGKEAVAPGEPAWDHASLLADDESLELPSTSHISIVDASGNALSMTTTIENAFGSRIMVNGFLLNNELTDFSFRTHRNGVPIANRVEPGKRPRSSMAPTIVLRDGKPVLVVGSPGGSRIIGYVAKTIINILDWNMDVQQAVSTGHLVNRFGTYDIEEGTDAAKLAEPLAALGFEVKLRSLNSGLHAIAVRPDGLSGGADPRREGIAIGE